MNFLACFFAALLAAQAVRGFLRLRATTLAAPCLWAALSASCLALSAIIEPKLEGIGLSAFHFAIAATTVCPLVAVLGAKRPQDRGWQWVVLTLWIVLVWPAAQAVMLPAGIRLELFVAWKLFLWGLIALGLINFLPTRNWRAAILVAAGQIVLLREHLWLGESLSPAWDQLVGVGCLLSATTLVSCRRPEATDRLSSFSEQWKSFRDRYGTFWALRILGRVNQTAELRDWPLRLHWSGFETQKNQQPTETQLAELGQALATLLRRFVAQDD
ncbi:MAG: hypothetical protein GXP24_04790 [Planctomycetes bacterium]|nr:hypothetical protein [Planctomycetota bacterium]